MIKCLSLLTHRLVEMINDSVQDRNLRHYLYQVIHRCAEFGGEFREINGGISRGCPISPILGALYLGALDNHFANKNVYYICYMDDILVLSKTRWQNRKVVRELNQILNGLKVEKHPDKTFIGKIEKGFDFLGYHFSKEPLKIARITWQKHALHITQLYEQLRKKKATSNEMASSLGLYVTRWQRWAVAGLKGISFKVYGDRPGTFKNLQYQPISIPVYRQVIIQRHRKINLPACGG
jgi:RNA-directed DNA polymerase